MYSSILNFVAENLRAKQYETPQEDTWDLHEKMKHVKSICVDVYM